MDEIRIPGDGAPGAARKRGLSPDAEAEAAAKKRILAWEQLEEESESESEEEAGKTWDELEAEAVRADELEAEAEAERAAKKRNLSPEELESEASSSSEAEEEAAGKTWDELEAAAVRADELEAAAEKRNLESCEPARPGMRGVGDDQDEMTLAKAVEEEDQHASFTPKSPISMPYIPDELNDPTAYPETLAAFMEAQDKYKAKLRRRYQLYTLPPEPRLAPSCLFMNPRLLPVRESAKKAVLHAAKFIIRLSSSVDGKPLASCSGLWVKWDRESKTGIVLTAAHLIRSNRPTVNEWEGRDEYDTEAKVIVHLLDNTTAEGHFLYHQEHYDLAFFKVRVDEPVALPSFHGSVHCGLDVFRLGRDDHMNIRITNGRVEHWNPGRNDRHHYMYFLHEKNDDLAHQKNDDYLSHKRNDDYLSDDDGGSIIDLDGKVVGLVNKQLKMSFVPSCILKKCVDLWCEFRCIPRLHLGMKFISIKLLDPIHVEKMWRTYKIESGLIVQEVSKESHAEKLGICLGDIIERFDGERISTTVEFENMLLGRCRDHLDQGNHLNDEINVSIQVFHTEERLRRTINLIVDVSDGGEVVKRSHTLEIEGPM